MMKNWNGAFLLKLCEQIEDTNISQTNFNLQSYCMYIFLTALENWNVLKLVCKSSTLTPPNPLKKGKVLLLTSLTRLPLPFSREEKRMMVMI